MSNPMKYIRDLEAVGFERVQAEAQVQMTLDILEGVLVTKNDFANFKEHVDFRFREQELKIVIKLGLLNVTTITLAIAVLGWLKRV